MSRSSTTAAQTERRGLILSDPHRGFCADVLKRFFLSAYMVLSVCAASAVIGALYIADRLSVRDPLIAAMFAVLLVAGELVPLRWLKIDENADINASWAFAFALLLVESTLVAIIAMAAASIVADLVHRKT